MMKLLMKKIFIALMVGVVAFMASPVFAMQKDDAEVSPTSAPVSMRDFLSPEDIESLRRRKGVLEEIKDGKIVIIPGPTRIH